MFFFSFNRLLIHCHDKEYEPQTVQRGDFWVLKNYVRADHGELRCFETLTYTTHADYTFLDNLIPLLERYVILVRRKSKSGDRDDGIGFFCYNVRMVLMKIRWAHVVTMNNEIIITN